MQKINFSFTGGRYDLSIVRIFTKAFGTNEILNNASFHIEEREKAGACRNQRCGKIDASENYCR